MPSFNPLSNYSGLALPIIRKKGSYFNPVQVADLVWSSYLRILGTPKGSAIMRPNLGSSFSRLLFEPNDYVLQNEIFSTIPDELNSQEPRAEIVELSPSLTDHSVSLMISYKLKRSADVSSKGVEIRRSTGFEIIRQFNTITL